MDSKHDNTTEEQDHSDDYLPYDKAGADGPLRICDGPGQPVQSLRGLQAQKTKIIAETLHEAVQQILSQLPAPMTVEQPK